MLDSILNTIKQMLGISLTDTAFDQDIMVNINTALMTLHQLGIGTAGVYSVDGMEDKWTDFLIDPDAYPAVKTYIYLCVRLSFDSPSASFLLDSLKRQKEELEWRLAVQVPIPPEPPTVPEP